MQEGDGKAINAKVMPAIIEMESEYKAWKDLIAVLESPSFFDHALSNHSPCLPRLLRSRPPTRRRTTDFLPWRPENILHINFRWEKDKIIVLNSRIANAWGSEIRHENVLHHDQHFDLQVRIHGGYYHITVNGVLLADYPHRADPQLAQAIQLEGNVQMESITFEGFQAY
ncbi:unnamed protein product [Caenorhabditis auriculariae]|uniref:Galectin n=1 Tax=Caenorhabditis auriculariae TaxID=2777116 RepID=A0A8S1GQG1_9PELO|nr:unnamed protein product [Caenorhabditis auriculariae]